MIISQSATSLISRVNVIRCAASSRDTRGRLFENIGAKRMFLSTSASALRRAASEMSTITAWIPCRTRSVDHACPDVACANHSNRGKFHLKHPSA